MNKTRFIIEVLTPITDEHKKKLLEAMKAVAYVQIVDEYVQGRMEDIVE